MQRLKDSAAMRIVRDRTDKVVTAIIGAVRAPTGKGLWLATPRRTAHATDDVFPADPNRAKSAVSAAMALACRGSLSQSTQPGANLRDKPDHLMQSRGPSSPPLAICAFGEGYFVPGDLRPCRRSASPSGPSPFLVISIL
jgi:hypothetical protein